MTIALNANVVETIDRFVERQAATWGARRDTDWCEEFRETTDAGSINLGLFFDDFRFVATIRSSDQAEIGALAGSSTLRQTSEMIDQRYGRRTRIGADNAINLTFEH
jgi:hypothetical protein